MKSATQSKKHIEQVSRKAMKSQLASFHIEGLYIPRDRAEKIRREVVGEFQKAVNSPNS